MADEKSKYENGLVQINFSEVPVFWAKVLPGQEEGYKDGIPSWRMDVSLDEETAETLEDEGFNIKSPDKKIIRAGKKEGAEQKDVDRAEQEELRGLYIRVMRNTHTLKKGPDGKGIKGEIGTVKEPPILRDRRNNPWPANKKIGNGSICNVECVAKYWPGNQYVTLYLLAVQVVEYVAPPIKLDEHGDPVENTSPIGETFQDYGDE